MVINLIFSGFGVTTHIINGGVECGKGTELQQSLNRQEYFRYNSYILYTTIFKAVIVMNIKLAVSLIMEVHHKQTSG